MTSKKISPAKSKESALKKPEPFSGVFYQNIPLEKEEASGGRHPHFDQGANKDQRTLLAWLGAIVVMAALLIMWFGSLPERLRIAAAQSESENIFKKPAEDFRQAWRTSNERFDDLNDLATALSVLAQQAPGESQTEDALQTASSTGVKLTAEQVEKLKNKIK